jgi:hypothetical protein
MLTLSGATRALASTQDEDRKQTADETREAEELAIRFMKRLQETDDLKPLIDEFFVADFTDHFKLYVKGVKDNGLFFQYVRRRVLMRASRHDLRRAYAALFNFYNQTDLLYDAALDYVSATNIIENSSDLWDAEHEKLRRRVTDDALTPSFFYSLNVDLLIKATWDGTGGDGGSNEELEREINAATITSVRRLRAFTANLNKCVALMRAGVQRLKAEQRARAKFPRVLPVRDRERFSVYKSFTNSLEKETAGLPARTRFYYARIYPFEMLMIRRGGRLRILAAYPDFDGD